MNRGVVNVRPATVQRIQTDETAGKDGSGAGETDLINNANMVTETPTVAHLPAWKLSFTEILCPLS